MFEMEQVIPGDNPSDPFDDPITRSNELKAAGDLDEARTLLAESVDDDVGAVGAYIAPVEIKNSGAIMPKLLSRRL